MMTFGAIDIGSNAMRLAIGRFNNRGEYEILATQREAVRLGHDVFRLRRITPKLMERAVAALLSFERTLNKHKVKIVRAVGTSALRDAANGELFIARVLRATGIQIEVISGDEEASLIHAAVGSVMNLHRGTNLLIDIGGGSVEVSLLHRGGVVFSDSVRMGTVRLLEMLRGRKQPEAVLQRLIRQYGEGIRRQIKRRLKGSRITCAIGTGGNFESLGELRRKILHEKSAAFITRSELQRLMTILQGRSIQERITEFGLRADRADVIVPAAALVLGILREAGVSTIRIPQVGLREGILVDLYEKSLSTPEQRPLVRRSEETLANIIQLGRRYDFDQKHAEHTAKLALQIFDSTKRIHKLGAEARLILHAAALLHDIGYFINGNDHHKHSSYIISQSAIVGLSETEKLLVSVVARYHRGSLPSAEQSEWQSLSQTERTTVKVLAGILRVVEELDKEHLRRVSQVMTRITGNTVRFTLRGTGELLVELWGAEKRKPLLEDGLNREIAFSGPRRAARR